MFETYEEARANIAKTADFDDYVWLQARKNGKFVLLNWNPGNAETYFRGVRIN